METERKRPNEQHMTSTNVDNVKFPLFSKWKIRHDFADTQLLESADLHIFFWSWIWASSFVPNSSTEAGLSLFLSSRGYTALADKTQTQLLVVLGSKRQLFDLLISDIKRKCVKCPAGIQYFLVLHRCCSDRKRVMTLWQQICLNVFMILAPEIASDSVFHSTISFSRPCVVHNLTLKRIYWNCSTQPDVRDMNHTHRVKTCPKDVNTTSLSLVQKTSSREPKRKAFGATSWNEGTSAADVSSEWGFVGPQLTLCTSYRHRGFFGIILTTKPSAEA